VQPKNLVDLLYLLAAGDLRESVRLLCEWMGITLTET